MATFPTACKEGKRYSPYRSSSLTPGSLKHLTAICSLISADSLCVRKGAQLPQSFFFFFFSLCNGFFS